MSASDESQKDHAAEGGKSLGLRVTEKLLPIFGPPPVDNSTEHVKETTQEEQDRDDDLEAELVRKKGSDGVNYVQARDEQDTVPEV